MLTHNPNLRNHNKMEMQQKRNKEMKKQEKHSQYNRKCYNNLGWIFNNC